MRKIIGAINMSIDGYAEHTAMIADEEIHQHYADLINQSGLLLYGRITYQLMEDYWPGVVEKPTGNQSTDDFAVAIDRIPKIVYSRSLKQVSWKNTEIKNEINREEIAQLKQQAGSDILAGSRGMIMSLLNLNLLDELQLCIHPVVLSKGTVPLFQNLNDRIFFKLESTKRFGGGAMLCRYVPAQS